MFDMLRRFKRNLLICLKMPQDNCVEDLSNDGSLPVCVRFHGVHLKGNIVYNGPSS